MESRISKKIYWLKEILTWCFFLTAALAVRSSLASTYVVPTESMEPTILPGDRLFADQRAYGWHLPFTDAHLTERKPPKHGEIVIFPSPVEKKITLIKRVIAIGGDTIEVRQGAIYLNGKALKRTKRLDAPQGYKGFWERSGKVRYKTQYQTLDPNARDFGPIQIPKGHFFVMGDNRDNSGDSRFFGTVSYKKLQARALRHFYSLRAQKFPYVRWSRIGSPLK